MGGDCALQTCPFGKPWFAEPGQSLPGFVSVSNGATTVTTTKDLRTYISRGDSIVINGFSSTVDNTGTFDATTLTLASAYTGSTVAYAEAYGRIEYARLDEAEGNRGTCDRATGLCSCNLGFTGAACDRLSCPTATSGLTCSGHGRCESLSSLAALTRVNGEPQSYTYGVADAHAVAVWDKDMIFGCKCDESLLEGGYYDFTGYDCSERKCPTGDDPSTDGVNEVQTLSCQGTSGGFYVTFRDQITSTLIPYSATAAEFKIALEALSTINGVDIAIASGSTICQDPSVDTTITFTQELGDVPLMIIRGSTVTSATVGLTTDGTKENVECSARGLCDRTTGICNCFAQYVSSDGNDNYGTRADCGMRDALFTPATSS